MSSAKDDIVKPIWLVVKTVLVGLAVDRKKVVANFFE